jgi:hypothetical protein
MKVFGEFCREKVKALVGLRERVVAVHLCVIRSDFKF